MRAIIVSDGRDGHLNQSKALLCYLGMEYDILPISKRFFFSKTLSYIFDRLSVGCGFLYRYDKSILSGDSYALVVGAGSLTYPMVSLLAREFDSRSVAMMLPKGFRYERFDYIFAQHHDKPPKRANIIEIPANFSYIKPKKLYQRTKDRAIAIVIGGSNSKIEMKRDVIKRYIDEIVTLFDGYEVAITTSPRTSRDISDMVESMEFDYSVIFHKNPINPISDFLDFCEYIFITEDSTSMISEAISYGKSCVEVLSLGDGGSKYRYFLDYLVENGYIHRFKGGVGCANKKVDFMNYAKRIEL